MLKFRERQTIRTNGFCVCVCVCVCVFIAMHIFMSIMFLSQTSKLLQSQIEGENLGHNWAYKIHFLVANYITSLIIKICIWKKCVIIIMNMWSRSTYKRLRKRSNSFPVHKKLVWPTDLSKSEEEIFNSSQPRACVSGSQLCVAIDPDLTLRQNVHCIVCWRIKGSIEILRKRC